MDLPSSLTASDSTLAPRRPAATYPCGQFFGARRRRRHLISPVSSGNHGLRVTRFTPCGQPHTPSSKDCRVPNAVTRMMTPARKKGIDRSYFNDGHADARITWK